MVDHITAWKKQDLKEAERIWKDAGLDNLHEYVYRGWSRFHLRDKLGGWLRGLYPSYRSRPPMPRPRQEEVLTLRERLIGAGFDVISEQEVKRILPKLLP
ncbi:MAG: dihydrodipicolinate synthase family protein, partial [Chloroflexota bacterium]